MTPPTSDDAAAETPDATTAGSEWDEPSSLEKGLDFTIGAALLTAETLEQVIGTLVEKGKIARENAPSVFETLMERGRPTREQWLRTVKDEILPQFKLGGPGGSAPPAEEEIQTLENRVATLEQQVSPVSNDASRPDDAIAHEATVATGGQHTPAVLPDAPTQPAVSEEVTTGTPAEPQTVAPTEESDAATTGADTATDIEVDENVFPGARNPADEGSAA